ncbi:MAG TPA: hypothetical protein VD963_08240 [Phycisphaerales bacterium]|nr:hypothetical protein [Phycisphaerales bacterium]
MVSATPAALPADEPAARSGTRALSLRRDILKALVIAFKLTKHYLDCVTPDGRAFIGYWARLDWLGVRVVYASTILHDRARGDLEPRTTTASTVRGGPGPVLGAARASWECAPLGLSGSWEPTAEPIDRLVLDDADGTVRWHCLMPRARARVRVEGGGTLEGLGYAETVELTVAPWNLPIQELRWGRFGAESGWAVWFEWAGARPQRLLVENGRERAPVSLGDEGVCWDDGSVGLGESSTIREGALGMTALAGVAPLRKLVPPAVLGTREAKWLSRARMTRGGTAPVPGWAIHEVVRFGSR